MDFLSHNGKRIFQPTGEALFEPLPFKEENEKRMELCEIFAEDDLSDVLDLCKE